MSLYAVEFTPGLGEALRRWPPPIKRSLRDALRRIASNPASGKLLQGELDGLRSYRLGTYRIVYRVRGRRVEVVAIGPRRFIYEESALAIKRERGARGE